MHTTLSDLVMFARCMAATTRSSIHNFGLFHGIRLSFWWGIAGVRAKHEEAEIDAYWRVKQIAERS